MRVLREDAEGAEFFYCFFHRGPYTLTGYYVRVLREDAEGAEFFVASFTAEFAEGNYIILICALRVSAVNIFIICR